ncbi:hypothetical protein [Methanoregula sp.]|uniref:hypothetical protein n=1 Tax=Methanoregula sp. TaxID=2052170 RepID=UPI003BB18955
MRVSLGIVLTVLVAGLALYYGAGISGTDSHGTARPATGFSAGVSGSAVPGIPVPENRSVPGAPAQAAGNGTGDPGPAYSQSAGRQVRDSTRSWHFDVDTSTWPPDEYLVVATSIQPRVTATARFCVAEPPAGYLQPALFAPAKDPVQPENQSYAGIGIDPVPDHYTGDRFAITGTTNLAAGDEILIVITPVSFGPTKGEVGEVGGTSGMATVLADGPAVPGDVPRMRAIVI